MKRVIVLTLALALAGCGTYRWEKEGASREDWQRDGDACRAQTSAGQADQWNKCMAERGWSRGWGWI